MILDEDDWQEGERVITKKKRPADTLFFGQDSAELPSSSITDTPIKYRYPDLDLYIAKITNAVQVTL